MDGECRNKRERRIMTYNIKTGKKKILRIWITIIRHNSPSSASDKNKNREGFIDCLRKGLGVAKRENRRTLLFFLLALRARFTGADETTTEKKNKSTSMYRL